METNRLYNIAEKNGVTVERFDLRENGSVSVKSGKNLYVALDNGMCGANEKVCLAHELGHCVTLSFYNMYSPLDVRGKHERKAQSWAIKTLIPKSKLKTALKKGYDNVYSLAEYFGVTADFMLQAVEFYKGA
jgi:hypothetical protein